MVRRIVPRREVVRMAKHRRPKSKAPVDYGMCFLTAAVVAGALTVVRWLIRRIR